VSRGHVFCKDPAHEAGVTGDQQLGHGVGRGRLRSIRRKDRGGAVYVAGS
jgi:hypothetical protein